MKSVRHSQRRVRIAGGLTALTLGAAFSLTTGTANAATNTIVIDSAVAYGLGAGVNVTYTCYPGTGGKELSAAVYGGGNFATGATNAVLCDGVSHNAGIGASCILPSNSCNFYAGEGQQVQVGLNATAGNATASGFYILQPH